MRDGFGLRPNTSCSNSRIVFCLSSSVIAKSIKPHALNSVKSFNSFLYQQTELDNVSLARKANHGACAAASR